MPAMLDDGHEPARLIDRTLAGMGVPIRPTDDAVVVHALPVVGERVVDEPHALARLGERETDAVVRGDRPVHMAVVVRDIDAVRAGRRVVSPRLAAGCDPSDSQGAHETEEITPSRRGPIL